MGRMSGHWVQMVLSRRGSCWQADPACLCSDSLALHSLELGLLLTVTMGQLLINKKGVFNCSYDMC